MGRKEQGVSIYQRHSCSDRVIHPPKHNFTGFATRTLPPNLLIAECPLPLMFNPVQKDFNIADTGGGASQTTLAEKASGQTSQKRNRGQSGELGASSNQEAQKKEMQREMRSLLSFNSTGLLENGQSQGGGKRASQKPGSRRLGEVFADNVSSA